LQAKTNELRRAGLLLVGLSAEQGMAVLAEATVSWAGTIVAWLKVTVQRVLLRGVCGDSPGLRPQRSELAELHATILATAVKCCREGAAVPAAKREITSSVFPKWIATMLDWLGRREHQARTFTPRGPDVVTED
jgi:hypothetical protein